MVFNPLPVQVILFRLANFATCIPTQPFQTVNFPPKSLKKNINKEVVLIPPAVEPELPPTNIKATVKSFEDSVSEAMSTVLNPAVRGVTALKKLGFDKVFDTDTGADFTIMEEANEFIEKSPGKTGGPCLFTDILLDDFAQIPQTHNTGDCFFFFLVICIVKIHGVRAAIGTFNLYVPATLVHQHTGTPANGALFQQNHFFHISFSLSENHFIGIVDLQAAAFHKVRFEIGQVFFDGCTELHGIQGRILTANTCLQ